MLHLYRLTFSGSVVRSSRDLEGQSRFFLFTLQNCFTFRPAEISAQAPPSENFVGNERLRGLILG